MMVKHNGYLLLAGGSEFQGAMAMLDRRALELAGGGNATVAIIPAAAAPDNNHLAAGSRAENWFRQFGPRSAVSYLVIDPETAADPAIATAILKASLIYLLGGFPGHLQASLAGSKCWDAMLTAWRHGAVLGGSSAGAMVLCEWFFNPKMNSFQQGLGLLENVCLIPHFHSLGAKWVARIKQELPDVLILGIDEETGLLNDSQSGGWTVYGPGGVYIDGNRLSEGDLISPDLLRISQI